MWNTYRVADAFEDGKPWLLRFFDQIKFYPVSGEELLQFRDKFLEGKRHIEMFPGRFRVRDYVGFVRSKAASIAAFKSRQQAAFDAERARWQETRDESVAAGDDIADFELDGALPLGQPRLRVPCPAVFGKSWSSPGATSAQARP
jgi:urea carboxylase